MRCQHKDTKRSYQVIERFGQLVNIRAEICNTCGQVVSGGVALVPKIKFPSVAKVLIKATSGVSTTIIPPAPIPPQNYTLTEGQVRHQVKPVEKPPEPPTEERSRRKPRVLPTVTPIEPPKMTPPAPETAGESPKAVLSIDDSFMEELRESQLEDADTPSDFNFDRDVFIRAPRETKRR